MLLSGALGIALAVGASAQEAYPTHPILLTHGNTPGSNSDLMARIIADPLAARLGQPVIVESRPGAGQTLAFGRIASGTPDGYTLIMMHSGHPIAGAMYKSLKYDTVNDFQMLSTLILYPFVLAVRQDHPLKSMADLIAYAKANPGKLSFSSTGVGTTQHLTGVLLQSKAGIEMNHISYRGATQAVQDVLGGRVDVLIETLTQTSPLISSGQMRGLAVTTAKAWPTQPDIPPLGDTVPGFEVNGWMGVATTHDTPQADRRPADARDRRGDQAAGGAPALRAAGQRGARQHAGGDARPRRPGTGDVEAGRQGRQHPAAVSGGSAYRRPATSP